MFQKNGGKALFPLPKKGCLSDCNNWRGITLLAVPGKAFCSIILNRLKTEITRGASRVRTGRSCAEQILTLRNIIDQSRKWQKPVFINYVDFKKSIWQHTQRRIVEDLKVVWRATEIHSYFVLRPTTEWLRCSTYWQVCDKVVSCNRFRDEEDG